MSYFKCKVSQVSSLIRVILAMLKGRSRGWDYSMGNRKVIAIRECSLNYNNVEWLKRLSSKLLGERVKLTYSKVHMCAIFEKQVYDRSDDKW